MVIRELKFVNAEARPTTSILHVSEESIPLIMMWYGGFNSGDDYKVFVDNKEVPITINGELDGDIPNG